LLRERRSDPSCIPLKGGNLSSLRASRIAPNEFPPPHPFHHVKALATSTTWVIPVVERMMCSRSKPGVPAFLAHAPGSHAQVIQDEASGRPLEADAPPACHSERCGLVKLLGGCTRWLADSEPLAKNLVGGPNIATRQLPSNTELSPPRNLPIAHRRTTELAAQATRRPRAATKATGSRRTPSDSISRLAALHREMRSFGKVKTTREGTRSQEIGLHRTCPAAALFALVVT